MENYELYHYGVKGMKWGVRRTPEQLGHKPSTKKTSSGKSKASGVVSRINTKIKTRRGAKLAAKNAKADQTAAKKPKKISEMTDEELRQETNRMRLENEYKREYATAHPKAQKGKEFAMRVLEKSGENLLTQVANHYGAKLLNNVIGEVDKKGLADAKANLAKLEKQGNVSPEEIEAARAAVDVMSEPMKVIFANNNKKK